MGMAGRSLHLPAVNGLSWAPRISVVVLTHNRRAEVLRTLDYLSSLADHPRVIVVDNGSRDGTSKAVLEAFPQISLIRLERNIGAAARNAGIEATSTPYVALCDDDTWWEPGALTAACRLLDDHPRLAVVNGTVLVGPQQQLDPASRLMAAGSLPARSHCPGMPILGFLAGASVVRKEPFCQAGGFESRYFIGGEEDLVALDLAARGWDLAYIPEIVVRHYPSVERQADHRRNLLLRNAVWTAWLRRPLPAAVGQTLRLAGTSRPGDGRTWALKEIVRGLPWVLKRRQVVPSELEALLRRLEGHP
jgi:GT2 family glycosyltransferase